MKLPIKAKRMWLYTSGKTGKPIQPWMISIQQAHWEPPAKPDVPVLVLIDTPETQSAREIAGAAILREMGFQVNGEEITRRFLEAFGLKASKRKIKS